MEAEIMEAEFNKDLHEKKEHKTKVETKEDKVVSKRKTKAKTITSASFDAK